MWPEHTAFERVHRAVCSLAESASPLQERLETAGVTLTPLLKRDFREGEERDQFERIIAALTEQGEISITTLAMPDEGAEGVAREIVELYGRLFF